MRIPAVATRKTATVSGFVLALGLAAYDYLAHFLKLESPYNSILFFAVLATLFFVPVVMFVIGTDGMTAGWRDLLTRRFWLESMERFVRALCWLFGAGLAWAILAAFASLTR